MHHTPTHFLRDANHATIGTHAAIRGGRCVRHAVGVEGCVARARDTAQALHHREWL